MWGDKVLEEVRAAREAHAARFDFDVKAIVADLRQRESTSGHPVIMPTDCQSAGVSAQKQPIDHVHRKAG